MFVGCVYRWHVTEHGGRARVVQQRKTSSCNMHAAAARGASHKDDHSLKIDWKTPG
jgi:hypothetical protein